MTEMTTLTALIDRYFATWNETDQAARRRLIEQTWTDDAHYVDPLLDAEGHAGLDAMVAGVHAQLPGHRFRRTTAIDVHHASARFGWELVAPDGSVYVAGLDVAEVAGERLRTITGFFGPLADEAAA